MLQFDWGEIWLFTVVFAKVTFLLFFWLCRLESTKKHESAIKGRNFTLKLLKPPGFCGSQIGEQSSVSMLRHEAFQRVCADFSSCVCQSVLVGVNGVQKPHANGPLSHRKTQVAGVWTQPLAGKHCIRPFFYLLLPAVWSLSLLSWGKGKSPDKRRDEYSATDNFESRLASHACFWTA